MDRSAAASFPPVVPHAPVAGAGRDPGSHRRPPGRLVGVLRGRRGRRYLAAASVLLLVVVTAIVLLTGRQSPETVVRDFYAALAARDAGAARMLLFSDVTVDKDVALLTDAILRSPGYTPPSRIRLTRLPAPRPHFPREGEEKEEEEALVRVDGELAGRAWQREVRLGRGGPYGDRWVMLGGPVGLGVTSSIRDGVLIVAGTPYRRSGRDLVVFPGAYQVALAEHPLFEADPVTALAGSSPEVQLTTRVRADARLEIDRQIRVHLDACAASREVNAPGRCRLADVMTLTLAQLRAARASRRITRYPTVLVEETGGIEHPLGFRTEMPGEIEVVIRTSPTGAPLINRTETLEVSGTVDVVGGAVVVNPAF
ncbi:hypothetical protein [Micromonospora globispora]|uniref:hypothetical protein n=1 Tax=Micromonospora globispora TaxID=1450148 RepID=UPI000F5E90E7|nr:hypothetical protein [Micromonospora globispora]